MSKTIDMVFDGPPEHASQHFVQAERDGKPISLGGWIKRDDGKWCLRIPDHEYIERQGNGAVLAVAVTFGAMIMLLFSMLVFSS